MTRYIIAALVLALAYASWVIKRSYVELGIQRAKTEQAEGALKIVQEAITKDRALIAKHAAANATAAREAALLRQRLDRALDSSPDWANATVPQEVLDALQ